MKTITKKRSVLNYQKEAIAVALLMLFISISSFTVNAKEISKTYSSSCAIATTDIVDIYAKHMDNVMITTTEGQHLSLKVTVNVTGADKYQEKVAELLKQLSFDIDHKNGKAVIVLSPFKSRSMSSGLFSGEKTEIVLKNGKKFSFNGKVNIAITAKLVVPINNPVAVDARHSDFTVQKLAGELNLELEHCDYIGAGSGNLHLKCAFADIEMGLIAGDAVIELRHSELEVVSAQNITVNGAQHSEIEFTTIKNVIMKSVAFIEFESNSAGTVSIESIEHSSLEIDNLTSMLVVHSRHSEIETEKAGKISINELSFGNLRAGSVASLALGDVTHSDVDIAYVGDEKIKINAQHSEIKIDGVSKNLTELTIRNSHNDVKLNLSAIPNCEVYLVDSQHSSFSGEGFDKKADGYYIKGAADNTSLKVKLTTPFCSVKIY